ncbi:MULTISPECIES: phosphopantetheine-binding protein [unclassified Streptomyces]|jgi:acyl carrier protein|uniref:phosphopantetheine-binding protein n=1 Tax=unclassified Streptomyces TaxID=2593676 RepID=UPI00225A8767|nr:MULTISPECIES: phosphopantetheine-binding protein [unclassified Streptomyces]MCX4409548.1 phosphopantetheine-binding protein [Streptomyces sp. NBC_01764]MCX5191319.1 phosphopantetheine-binding protein [Streptomyces sp. NBC_00268]
MTHTTQQTDPAQTASADAAALHEHIEALVETATGRVVTAADLRAAGGDLDRAGVNSIGYINLMEALEQRFGVLIDPEADPQYLASVDSIALFLAATRA